MATRRPGKAAPATAGPAPKSGSPLDAALEPYGTRGYLGTGVKDVCRAAGLTERYFYESFRNSEQLFTATFDRATDELLRLVADAEQGPEPQVRAAIGAFVTALAEDPRVARLIFLERASAGPEAERHIHARHAAAVRHARRRDRAPYLPADAPEREQVVDYLVEFCLAAATSFGMRDR